jgi:hypothetical protein
MIAIAKNPYKKPAKTAHYTEGCKKCQSMRVGSVYKKAHITTCSRGDQQRLGHEKAVRVRKNKQVSALVNASNEDRVQKTLGCSTCQEGGKKAHSSHCHYRSAAAATTDGEKKKQNEGADIRSYFKK